MINEQINYFTPVKLTADNVPKKIDTELTDKNGYRLDNPQIENRMKFVG